MLGWNNEKKKEALRQQRAQLIATHEQAAESLQRATNKNARLQDQVFSIKHIREHAGFKSITTHGIMTAIHHLEGQMAELRTGSDQLKTLTQQLEDIRQQIGDLEQERDEGLRQRSVGDHQLRQMEKDRLELAPLLDLLTGADKDRLLQFQQLHAGLIGGDNLTLDNIGACCGQLTESAERSARQHEEIAGKEGRELDRAIHKIKNPPLEVLQRFTDWAADTRELPLDRENTEEYMEWLEKLETENLPRFKRDFERLLHDTAVIKMGVLNEELESWERKIRNSINSLNQSLSGINFNRLPDTYIQLGIRPVTDTVIKEFRGRLLNALPQSADWQQNSFEDKALHFKQNVQAFIHALDESESYRSRVLDVRNWFEFWADEKFRETNELKKDLSTNGAIIRGGKSTIDLHHPLQRYRLSIRDYQRRAEFQEPAVHCCRREL